MRSVAIGIACVVCLLTMPVSSSGPLAMKLTPPMAVAPASLVIRTTVDPSEDNRWLVLQIASPNYYRSSEMQLDGKYTARTSEWTFKGLPAGRYNVTAVLVGANGNERASTSQWFEAARMGGS